MSGGHKTDRDGASRSYLDSMLAGGCALLIDVLVCDDKVGVLAQVIL